MMSVDLIRQLLSECIQTSSISLSALASATGVSQRDLEGWQAGYGLTTVAAFASVVEAAGFELSVRRRGAPASQPTLDSPIDVTRTTSAGAFRRVESLLELTALEAAAVALGARLGREPGETREMLLAEMERLRGRGERDYLTRLEGAKRTVFERLYFGAADTPELAPIVD